MPLKINSEETQILKIEVDIMDHVRLVKYGKRIGMTKRKAGNKILSDFLRKNVKLKEEA